MDNRKPPEVRARYRVLEPREDPTPHCVHTSRTYPNIMVSVLEGSAPGAAHVIARTLLSIKEIAPGHHWGVATDLRPALIGSTANSKSKTTLICATFPSKIG